MRNLTDEIERYIQRLLAETNGDAILLRRNDLASKLRCAPSQISYVLATRFNDDRGYIVESRRGSGGYVRIYRIGTDIQEGNLLDTRIGRAISIHDMIQFLHHMYQERQVTRREVALIKAVLDGKYIALSDEMRATLLKALMSTLVQS